MRSPRRDPLRVPAALDVTVRKLAAGVGLGLVVAAASAGCSTASERDAGADAAEECTFFLREDGTEIYRLCPTEPGSECANRIDPDGTISDGGC